MGWTSYYADYYKNGKIDRKAECDAYFMDSLNKGLYKVLKSSMVGTVYYAAIQNQVKYVGKDELGNGIYANLSENEKETWAAIFLTQTQGNIFYYKDMDETCLPGYYDCPKGILDLLSPTDNEYALEWRKKCRENKEKKKNNIIKDLPYGAKVIWHRYDGQDTTLIKRPPSYQFKTWWWQIDGEQRYVSKKRVTEDRIEVLA